MARIDIERLLCSLRGKMFEGSIEQNRFDQCLKEQGFEYKEGKLVPIQSKTEDVLTPFERLLKDEYADEAVLERYGIHAIADTLLAAARKQIADGINVDTMCSSVQYMRDLTFTAQNMDSAYRCGILDTLREVRGE